VTQRHLITLGASTTAGGKVNSASSRRYINGVQVALEGDKVLCPCCKSTGRIQLAGPRLTELCNGKQVALHDDLCLCACPSPPRLVANQRLVSQNIDTGLYADDVADAVRSAAILNTAARAASEEIERLPILLIDPATGEPLRHCSYRLQLADRTLEGQCDGNGATQPLTAAERESLVTWQAV
jgi:uncharacterized Zn-binding protein involved in type VI secretion